jgi:hypothetical protein
MKKAKGEFQKAITKEIGGDKITDGVLKEATKDVAGKAFKTAVSIGMLFFEFIDAYSKAVKQANLDNVRQNLEVCPHIGGCQTSYDAMNLVREQEVTAWRAFDGFWYFHPQTNYRVRHAAQIYRFLPHGNLTNNCAIEQPGKPKVETQDCLACVEAHAGEGD